jgi:hypothetical protein
VGYRIGQIIQTNVITCIRKTEKIKNVSYKGQLWEKVQLNTGKLNTIELYKHY